MIDLGHSSLTCLVTRAISILKRSQLSDERVNPTLSLYTCSWKTSQMPPLTKLLNCAPCSVNYRYIGYKLIDQSLQLSPVFLDYGLHHKSWNRCSKKWNITVVCYPLFQCLISLNAPVLTCTCTPMWASSKTHIGGPPFTFPGLKLRPDNSSGQLQIYVVFYMWIIWSDLFLQFILWVHLIHLFRD